jgi:predicted nucleotidyltransferase component of viral defense system
MEGIRTTQQKVIAAYTTLTALRKKVRGKDALDLFYLKNRLQENIDFQAEEETRLVADHGGKVTDGGQIIIEDPEKRAAFQKAMGELGVMECEIKAEPVKVSLDRNPDITLGEIEALDGFVKFV